MIVIIWRTKTGRFGISHEALITNEDTINSPDVVDAGDVFRSTDSVDSPIVPVVKKPCRVRAIVSSKNLQVGTIGQGLLGPTFPNPRTTRIYLDGRVLRLIIKPRPSFGHFSTVI